jgi:hypothetical protein
MSGDVSVKLRGCCRSAELLVVIADLIEDIGHPPLATEAILLMIRLRKHEHVEPFDSGTDRLAVKPAIGQERIENFRLSHGIGQQEAMVLTLIGLGEGVKIMSVESVC